MSSEFRVQRGRHVVCVRTIAFRMMRSLRIHAVSVGARFDIDAAAEAASHSLILHARV
jgi:hypothetical protein